MIIIKTDSPAEFKMLVEQYPDLLKGFSTNVAAEASMDVEEEVVEEEEEVVEEPTRNCLQASDKAAIAIYKEVYNYSTTETAKKLDIKREVVTRWYQYFNEAGGAIAKFSKPGKSGNRPALLDYVDRLTRIIMDDSTEELVNQRAHHFLTLYNATVYRNNPYKK